MKRASHDELSAKAAEDVFAEMTEAERVFLRQFVRAAMASRLLVRALVFVAAFGTGALAAFYYVVQIARGLHAMRNGQ